MARRDDLIECKPGAISVSHPKRITMQHLFEQKSRTTMGLKATTHSQQRAELAAHLIAKLGAKETAPAVRRQRFILFATPLVRAILDGRKTITRRPVKPPTRAPRETCPFCREGDRLWVREKWGYYDDFFDKRRSGTGSFVYAADGLPQGAKHAAWRPSLHMSRSACRLWLDVTQTRAERLMHVTSEDAVAEGCPPAHLDDPIGWFRATWDHYYAKSGCGWKTDPWV